MVGIIAPFSRYFRVKRVLDVTHCALPKGSGQVRRLSQHELKMNKISSHNTLFSAAITVQMLSQDKNKSVEVDEAVLC